MRNHITIENPELFNLQEPISIRALNILRKTKRTTATIISKELKCPHSVALWNLNQLVTLGQIKDLGKSKVNGRYMRIFEI